MNRIKKLILPILSILLIIVTTTFLVKKKREENINNYKNYQLAEEYNALLKDLREEKNKITKDLEDLKEDLTIKGKGSSLILLADCNSKVVYSVSKQLEQYGYTGVIAVDEYYFEHNDGNYLTLDELMEFENKGYDIVLSVNGSSDIVEIYNKFTKLGLKIKGFYFSGNDVNNTQLESIDALNIEFVITYLDSIEHGDIVSIMSIGSYEANAKIIYEESIEKSLISALSIGSLRENEKYIEKNVELMLKLMNDYEVDDMTAVTNLNGAKIRLEAYQKELEKTAEESKLNKIKELEDKLKDIDLQITGKK